MKRGYNLAKECSSALKELQSLIQVNSLQESSPPPKKKNHHSLYIN